MYRALKLEQELDVEEQDNHDRLVHDYRRREEDLLTLICKMLGPREIGNQNLQKVCRENAVRKAKIEELESKIARIEASHIDRVKELESKIAQLEASHVERVKEQNAEIDGLNREMKDLLAQMPVTQNPWKRALSSETEQARPVEDTYEFIYCDSGQVPIFKNPRKRALSSETEQTRRVKGGHEFRYFDTGEMTIAKSPRKRASSSKQNRLDQLKNG